MRRKCPQFCAPKMPKQAVARPRPCAFNRSTESPVNIELMVGNRRHRRSIVKTANIALGAALITVALLLAGCGHKLVATGGDSTVSVYPAKNTLDKLQSVKPQGDPFRETNEHSADADPPSADVTPRPFAASATVPASSLHEPQARPSGAAASSSAESALPPVTVS